MNYEALRSEALLHAAKARTMAAKLFNDPQASQVDAGDLLLYMARLVDELCLAATPAPAQLPEGWKFNHARQQTDDDGPVSGVWEIGWLEGEDSSFSPIVTVDTGLYYQDKDAEPLAKAILSLLAGQGKEASNG